jgi:hypothetical protein
MLVLTPDELYELTRYKRQADQLKYLHARGFHRATLQRGRLILERAHYEAVCTGAVEQARPRVIPPKVTPPRLKVLPLSEVQPKRRK